MGHFPLYWPISLVWMQPKTKEALPAGSTAITAIGKRDCGSYLRLFSFVAVFISSFCSSFISQIKQMEKDLENGKKYTYILGWIAKPLSENIRHDWKKISLNALLRLPSVTWAHAHLSPVHWVAVEVGSTVCACDQYWCSKNHWKGNNFTTKSHNWQRWNICAKIRFIGFKE